MSTRVRIRVAETEDLDYCDIEWFALETNRDHSVVFETASKYCISDSCWHAITLVSVLLLEFILHMLPIFQ